MKFFSFHYFTRKESLYLSGWRRDYLLSNCPHRGYYAKWIGGLNCWWNEDAMMGVERGSAGDDSPCTPSYFGFSFPIRVVTVLNEWRGSWVMNEVWGYHCCVQVRRVIALMTSCRGLRTNYADVLASGEERIKGMPTSLYRSSGIMVRLGRALLLEELVTHTFKERLYKVKPIPGRQFVLAE